MCARLADTSDGSTGAFTAQAPALPAPADTHTMRARACIQAATGCRRPSSLPGHRHVQADRHAHTYPDAVPGQQFMMGLQLVPPVRRRAWLQVVQEVAGPRPHLQHRVRRCRADHRRQGRRCPWLHKASGLSWRDSSPDRANKYNSGRRCSTPLGSSLRSGSLAQSKQRTPTTPKQIQTKHLCFAQPATRTVGGLHVLKTSTHPPAHPTLTQPRYGSPSAFLTNRS